MFIIPGVAFSTLKDGMRPFIEEDPTLTDESSLLNLTGISSLVSLSVRMSELFLSESFVLEIFPKWKVDLKSLIFPISLLSYSDPWESLAKLQLWRKGEQEDVELPKLGDCSLNKNFSLSSFSTQGEREGILDKKNSDFWEHPICR